MVQFYKEKNFKFTLKNLDEKEQFTIWKAWDKRTEDVKDPAGNVMVFPIKEGHLTGTDNELREVTSLKFMKGDDFKRLYPMLSKNTKYVREIYVDGVENLYAFTMSANNKLKSLIETIKGIGSDPLAVTYEQTFDKNKQAAEMYGMKLSPKDGTNTSVQPVAPTPVVAPVVSNIVPPVTAEPPKPIKPAFVMASNEQEVVTAIKSMAQIPSEIAIINILKGNKIPEIRAKDIYKNVF